MKVSAQIKQQVETKLREGIATIQKHYGCKLDMPTILYTKGGGTAGVANYCNWTVNYNPVLLIENTDEFLARTVPHELAHLACDKIYPEAHQSNNDNYREAYAGDGTGYRFHPTRFRRAKRELHGSHWQEIMHVIGVKDVSRCHSYDVTNVKRKKARYQYKCAGCATVVSCGPKIHKQLQRDPKSRWHGGCKGYRLVLVTQQTPAKLKVNTPKKPEAGTKIAKAYALYKQWHGRYDRQGMIAVLMHEVGMTEAGASTYVYQCQKLYAAGVL